MKRRVFRVALCVFALAASGCATRVVRYPVTIVHRGVPVPGWLEAYPDSMRERWVEGKWRRSDGHPEFMPFGKAFIGFDGGLWEFESPAWYIPVPEDPISRCNQFLRDDDVRARALFGDEDAPACPLDGWPPWIRVEDAGLFAFCPCCGMGGRWADDMEGALSAWRTTAQRCAEQFGAGDSTGAR